MSSSLDPRKQPYLRGDPSASDTTTHDASSSKTEVSKDGKIRYSGDLELRLPFDTSPMNKPSTAFRDPVAWFKEVKEGAATNVAKQEQQQQEAVINLPDTAATFDRQASLARGGAGGASVFRNSLGFFVKKPSGAREPHFNRRHQGTVAFDEDDEETGRSKHLSQDPLVNSRGGVHGGTLPNSKRPAGPRAFGGNGMDTLKVVRSHNEPIQIPVPAFYKQFRVWTYILISLFASISLGIAVINQTASTTPAQEKASTAFFVFTAGVTIFLSFTCLVVYLAFGHLLFVYYDAPFLICQDIPTPHSPSSISMEPTDAPKSNPLSFLTLKKSRDDEDSLPRRTRNPSPWVPLLDIILHGLLFVFWCSTLSDFAVRIKTSPCNSTTAAQQVVCASPDGFNKMVAFVGVGGVVGLGVMICTMVKVYQMHQFGIVRSVIKRR